MALNSDACEFPQDHIGDEHSYRKAVLKTLCRLVAGIPAADVAASFKALVTTAHGAVSSDELVSVFDTGAAIRAGEIQITNGMDVDAYVSFDGTNYHRYIPAKTILVVNLKKLGKYFTGQVYARKVGASTTGSIFVGATY